jgi:acetyl esterase/lipase
VPVGYIFNVVLVGFCTAVAIIGPRPAHTTPSYWGFWATFLINEQPFVAFYLLAAATILAAGEGDLASPGGLAAFGVALLTVPGLAELVRRALTTGPVLRRTLRDAGIEIPPARRPWARILFPPLGVRRHNVVRVADIAYGDAGRHHRLDVYHRRDRPPGGSVMVFWHGGGYRSGDKHREGRAVLTHLAAQGWVCISANYRLAPAAHFPDPLVDAKRVIAWARSHAGDYGGDPRTVIASGSSAGAHLAMMVALTPHDPALQPGFEAADTSVAAAIGYYGYYGRSAGPGSSPLDRLGDAPPLLFLHGDMDSSTLVEDTRELFTQLRTASAHPVLYAELPGAQHTFDLFHSLRYSQVIEAVSAFCAWVRTREATPPADR